MRNPIMLRLACATMAVVAAGCGTSEQVAAQTDADGLRGRTFIASGAGLAEAPDGLSSASQVKLVVNREDDGGGAGWKADCNEFGGALEVDDETLVVQLESSTEQACTDAETRQDEALTSFLEAKPTWTLEEDRLTLTAEGGRITFHPQAAEDG